MPTIKSISDFRQQAPAMIKEVNETSNPLYLTQNGRAAAVLVSPEMWEKALNLKAMLQLLALSEKDVEAGKVVDFDEALDSLEDMIHARER